MASPSGQRKRKRRARYQADLVECIDCDGEADKPFTTHSAIDIPDMSTEAEPLPPAQLQAAVQMTRAALGARGTRTASVHHDEHTDTVYFGGDDELYLAADPHTADPHREEELSDNGIDDDDPDTLIPIQSSASDVRFVPPSSSRFASWHNRMAVVFELLYGANAKRRGPIEPPNMVTTCSCSPAERSLKLLIEVYDVGPSYPKLFETCKLHLFKVLIHAKLFPATSSRPQAAFTIGFIRPYQSLVNVAGISATNMALVFQQLLRHGVGFRRERWTYQVSDALRRQLKPALTWLTVVERYCDKMALECVKPWSAERPTISQDDLALTLAHLADSCPACFASFQQGPSTITEPIGPQVIIAIDGNFTQKRRGKHDPISRQPFPPWRFLSQRQVNEAAALMGRTGGSEPDQKTCIAKIRAADAVHTSAERDPYEINGLMGACCRNDIPLVMCGLDTPGERHYYAVALVLTIIEAVGPGLTWLGIVYDIGCRFAPSQKVANVLGPAVKITWTVPVLHVYGHTYSCQLRFNPRSTVGFGMTDGEGMERVWAGLASLITSTRNMHRGERRFALENRCQFIAGSRRVNLFDTLNAKSKRLDKKEIKAKAILHGFDPSSSVPSRSTYLIHAGQKKTLLEGLSQLHIRRFRIRIVHERQEPGTGFFCEASN